MRHLKIIPAVISVKLGYGRISPAPLHSIFPYLSEVAPSQDMNGAIFL
jgi:hypothetical protein